MTTLGKPRGSLWVALTIWSAAVAGCGDGNDPVSSAQEQSVNASGSGVIGTTDHVANMTPDIDRPMVAGVAARQQQLYVSNDNSLEEGYIPSCESRAGNDFIDGGTWDNRRLLPRNCEVLQVNPPVFNWRVPEDFKSWKGWSLVIKRSDGETVVVKQLSQAYYRHPQALTVGDYEWQVSYQSKVPGIGTVFSDVRRFRVTDEAELYLPPDGVTLAAAASSKTRPKILPAGMTFAYMRELAITGEYAGTYAALLRKAEVALAQPLPEEPPLPPPKGTVAWKTWKNDAQVLVEREAKRLEQLSFAWRLSGDSRFKDSGLSRLLRIAAWDPNGSTSDSNHDLVNSKLAFEIARGFDLYASELTTNQAAEVVQSIKLRFGYILPKFQNLDKQPYNQHRIQQLRASIQLLLLMAGESDFAEAETMLASVWEHLLRHNDPWGTVDGGFGQGTAYSWWAQNEMVGVLTTVRAVTGFDYSRELWIRNLPNFIIAHTTPNTRQIPSTGDGLDLDNHYDTYAHNTSRVFAMLTGSRELSWYWRQGVNATNSNIYLSPYHFIAYAMSGGGVEPRAPIQHSWHFKDAGLVAIHDKADATTTRSSVYFRSSPFGTHSHSLADNNAFVLVSNGNSLLIPGGYRPWQLSNHHALVGRATRYKNALTFDGGIGQAEPVAKPTVPGKPVQSLDTRGEIVKFEVKGPWTAATGDATLAYRGWDGAAKTWTPLLTAAIRSIAYNRSERVLIVFDYATSETARSFELNFNALSPFAVSGRSLRIDHGGSSACIQVYGAEGALSTTSGFAVAPELARPQQYQARFTAEPSTALAAVSVIVEDCRDVDVSIEQDGSVFRVSIAGEAAIILDRDGASLP